MSKLRHVIGVKSLHFTMALVVSLLAAGCAADAPVAPAPGNALAPVSPGGAHFSGSQVSSTVDVEVQALTTGPNGEIVDNSTGFSVCNNGTATIKDTTITFEVQCVSFSGNGPVNYDAGSVDVYLLDASGQVVANLGFVRANYSRLLISGVPQGSTLRLAAFPDVGSGASFVRWFAGPSSFTDETIDHVVQGGENFLASFTLESSPSGGPGPSDPCIICP